jgi:spore coat polysaccharide biosynthesis protein SpsF (cytidylyltransferase family)
MVPRVLAVVQARLGSTRLPGKALLPIAGRPMVAHVVERIAAAPGVDQVVLATTLEPEDDALEDFARSAGLPCVRGSVADVLDRFRTAVSAHPADVVVRATADCPLLDPSISGLVVAEYLRRAPDVDYVSNVHPPTYPDGLDTEVFSRAALERAWREASPDSSRDREHVTPYIWERRPERFRLANVRHPEDLSGLRWTVDDARDLDFVRAVYGALAPDGTRLFGMHDVLALLCSHPALAAVNAGTRRNEGFERSRRADLGAAKGQGA